MVKILSRIGNSLTGLPTIHLHGPIPPLVWKVHLLNTGTSLSRWTIPHWIGTSLIQYIWQDVEIPYIWINSLKGIVSYIWINSPKGVMSNYKACLFRVYQSQSMWIDSLKSHYLWKVGTTWCTFYIMLVGYIVPVPHPPPRWHCTFFRASIIQ